MRPSLDDFDDEIRGHIAICVKERIERGEDPERARLAATKEFGNLLLARESMQAVWRTRVAEEADALWQDIRVALRSLKRAKGLALTVAATLALGIGANAAVFSVVRQVLFQPLVNRDEDRLIYIRQSAPGLGAANTTFSMPEIRDLRTHATSVSAFGDFSTIEFALVGFGEPRVVRAGVVSGSYFGVMGLRPVLGRLLNTADDGPDAAGALVLTHRFWSSGLHGDASVVGRTVQLGTRSARVVGVLEPSIPYPADTEIIANVVTSPHHLGATMVEQRTHRMTELFGRLAPGATLEAARSELSALHGAMMRRHSDGYPAHARMELSVTPLRDQITAPARPILLMLLAAAGVVFAIACCNVANLILARTVRRETELAVRASLGAGIGALRRTLLAESLVLCVGGAVLGVLIARPLVGLVKAYAARFSVRALDVSVDASVLWVGAALAVAAAVVLAYVPRLPSTLGPAGCGPASRGLRLAPGTDRRLRAFAVAQVALSFVLLAGAGLIVSALLALQSAPTGFDMRRVLALDVPVPLEAGQKAVSFFREATRRIALLPGVERVAAGNFVPWRDASGDLLPRLPFGVEGHTPAPGEAEPHARLRIVTPGFFTALGIPLLSGRDFDDGDAGSGEPVVIVSQSVAQRLFRDSDALGKRLWWRSPVLGNPQPRRIVGIAADADDENVVPGPSLTVYHPLGQIPYASRLFVQASGDPYALVAPLRRTIRDISPLQPVERAATLADVRSEVLAPERRRAFVMSGVAGVALLIAVVGVAGVLAFTVSARTREFGVRLALGASRRQLLGRVLREGALIASVGIAAGAAGGYALGRLATSSLESVRLPGGLSLLGAAAVLLTAAVVASLLPAARASRVDVTQALRSE
jgi:predicted permease